MAFILNECEIEDAQTLAAHDFHRPNAQQAALTLARLMEQTNRMSDGWAYWKAPTAASTKLQKLVESRYQRWGRAEEAADITRAELKAAYTPIKAFLTRNKVDHKAVFINE